MLSGSVSVAVTGKPTRGCRVERVIVSVLLHVGDLYRHVLLVRVALCVGDLHGHFIHVIPARISGRLVVRCFLEGESARGTTGGGDIELAGISARQRPLQVGGVASTASSSATVNWSVVPVVVQIGAVLSTIY